MAPTIEDRLAALEKENVEIKRRLSTMEGQFEYISGQLRDVQLYMHARFEQIDKRFEQIDKRFEQIDKRFEQVDKRLDKVERDVATFRTEVNRRFDELPGIVRDVMREVLAESRKPTN